MRLSNTKHLTTCFVICLIVIFFIAVGVACSPQNNGNEETSAENSQGNSDIYANDFTWTADADCSLCHTTETESTVNSATLLGFHSSTQEMSCENCHTDSTELAKAHEGKTSSSKVPNRLRATKVEESACLSCHDDYPTLAQLTSESTALIDVNNTVVNPHALPANSDHAIITCTSCHVMHQEEVAQEAAMDHCVSCHHEKVFECGTCHEV